MTGRPVAPVPSLDELRKSPELVDELPHEALLALYRQAAVLEALLRARLTGSAAAGPAPEVDRALGIAEAAARLSMKQDTLYRKWRALRLGYRDADGRVKFSARALERYIAHKAGA